MTNPVEYIRKLNFPKIPDNLIPNFESSEDLETFIKTNKDVRSSFWTNQQNEDLNEWCQSNVCDSAYFGFTISNGQDIHKDIGTAGSGVVQAARLLYPVKLGGENIKTYFWADDKETILKEYVLETKCWYLLASQTYHSVDHVPEGQYRLLVTAQLLHKSI